MSVSGISPTKAARPFSIRRHVDRKIFRFSLSMGFAGVLLTVLVYFAAAYPDLQRAQAINQHALSEINCTGTVCDTGKFATDDQHRLPDYVVDSETKYLVYVPQFQEEAPIRFAPLDFADTAFVSRFRNPTSYPTLDGEVWRLYSRLAPTQMSGRHVEIIIGYALRAPSSMLTTPDSEIPDVDAELRRQADKIAENPQAVARGTRLAPRLSADGFALVDADTGEVVTWGPWTPMFLPKDKLLPAAGRQVYLANSALYIVQTDADERMIATSLVKVANLWWFSMVGTLALLLTSIIARSLSRRFLRNYFAVTGMRLPSLEEACRSGEGQSVEFKRGLSENEGRATSTETELLRSIAAFANTNDGVIFVGVDDNARMRGLELSLTQRDQFERKVRQLIRNHIKPSPPVDVTFEEVRGVSVARISVARGEAPIYLLGGVIYLRSGSSDVQAQPEDLRRLIAEFAF